MAFKIDTETIKAFDEKRTIANKRFLAVSMAVFILIILSFITHNLHHVEFGPHSPLVVVF